MESVGFNDHDFAIREGLESIVEKKMEERQDFLCMAYEELDRVMSAMLKERDSENAILRYNLSDLEKKLGMAESEVEILRDQFLLRESDLLTQLDRGVALLRDWRRPLGD